jgi:hypothetical protein
VRRLKMFKKVLAISLALVIALSLAACGKEAGDGLGLPSAEEIIEGAVQALDDIRTYQFEMNMSIDYSGEVEGEAYEMVMAMDLAGPMDLENREMIMDMTISIVMFGESMEMSAEVYLIGDMVYTMTEDPETGSMWEKSEMPEGFWEQMNQVEPQVEFLELVQVDVIGSEKVKGVDCYILQLTPDIEQLWQLAMEQAGVTGDEILPDIDEEYFQEIFKSFSVKQWVAKDTYFLTKAELDMAMELTPEALGYPEEEGIMTMDITIDLLAYNYNQPVSIVLPPGAEEAIEVPMDNSEGGDTVAAANTEAQNVAIAVLAAMVDNEVYELTAGGTVGPGYTSAVFAGDGVTELDITLYFIDFLEATYTLDKDGGIIAATPTPGGRWDGMTYTADQGWAQ